MMGFPPVAPEVSRRYGTRLPRDHYVRVDTCDYSVNPRFVGRRVDVTVTLDQVTVTCDGVEVARHRRVLAKHQTVLAAEHARVLRQMRAEAAEVAPVEVNVAERDLEVYDQILGVASPTPTCPPGSRIRTRRLDPSSGPWRWQRRRSTWLGPCETFHKVTKACTSIPRFAASLRGPLPDQA